MQNFKAADAQNEDQFGYAVDLMGIWMMDADGSNTALIFDELGPDDILGQQAWRE